MKKLFIVGAGGFGREVYRWASDHPDCGREWKIAGFLDDNPEALKEFDYPLRVLAPASGYQPEEGDLFVCGMGVPAVKRKVCSGLLASGAEFITLVHPTAIVGKNVKIGKGVMLCPGSIISCDCEIGDFVMLNLYATIGHDVCVGPWTTLSGHCDLTTGVRLGEAVFAGSRVSVLPGRTVSDEALLGAGCVVTRDVPRGITVFGAPARPLWGFSRGISQKD